jgi:Restriction endonuclease EcoRII, N-terminal
MKSISKILSANDLGATGGHQAGILIPKDPPILGFFPTLDARDYNPRCHLVFQDDGAGKWEFAFIYYNNALFSGTRNEYRLTRMTRYMRDAGLEIGDEVILKHDEAGKYHVGYRRKNQPTLTASGVLKLGSGWRVIQFGGGK